MLNRIKNNLKKNSKIRRLVRRVINYTYSYVKNAYYKKMFLYFVKFYHSEKHSMKKYGFKDIKIYNTHFWRYNDGIDHVYRRYYSAYFNDKKVFVKICKNDSTAQNEIKISEYLMPFDMPFLAKVETFSPNFNNGHSMLAIEFCAELRPFSIPETMEEFAKYCSQFLLILDSLNRVKLLHADVHKNNLMINDNDELILLDFGISISENVENSVNYLARPGTYYVQTDDVRIYDDAYSFVQMINNFNPNTEFFECDEYKQIVERINEFSIEIDMKQFV